MMPHSRTPTHPGKILLKHFLVPLGISQVAFARHLGISLQRLNGIIKGHRSVTPETAWLLAAALETSPEFWINLQVNYDMAKSRPRRLSVKPIARPEARSTAGALLSR